MQNDKQSVNFSYFLSIISAYALALSLSYNFAYFWEINLNLFSLLSLQDHILSALPWMLISIPLLIAVSIGGAMRLHFLVKNEEPDGSPAFALMGATIPIVYMGVFSDISRQVVFIASICLIWVAFIPFMFHRLTFLNMPNIDKYVILLMPAILSFSFAQGMRNSTRDMVSTDYAEVITEYQTKKGIIIRNLDKGIILKENNQYVFLPWGKIKSVGVSNIGYDVQNKTTQENKVAVPLSK